jgi:uncharacterized membrane protein YbaN (DUF454 family)
MGSLRKTLHIMLGIVLILLGVVGLVLPLLNGVLLLLLGFILLSFESPAIEQRLNRMAHRYENLGIWYDKLLRAMKKLFRM